MVVVGIFMPKTMSEAALAADVAKRLGLPKAEVRRVFDAQTTAADRATSRGLNVRTPFGALRWRKVTPRKGGERRIAPNGTPYVTKARKAGKKLGFRPAGMFRKLV